MSLINKEPFITPEMIAAWNAGSGGKTLLKSFTALKNQMSLDTTYQRYAWSHVITDAEFAEITASNRVMFEFVRTLSNGNTAIWDQQIVTKAELEALNRYIVLNVFVDNYSVKTNAYAQIDITPSNVSGKVVRIYYTKASYDSDGSFVSLGVNVYAV